MTNVELLTVAWAAGDNSDATLSALFDALREDESLSFADACTQIAWTRDDAEPEHTLALAAELLSEDSDYRTFLYTEIARASSTVAWATAVILLPGGQWPMIVKTKKGQKPSPPHNGPTVTVGARWVLRAYALHTDGGRHDWETHYRERGIY